MNLSNNNDSQTLYVIRILFLCFLLYANVCLAADKELPCERIGDETWGSPIGTQRTCHMRKNTVIDSTGVSISSDNDATVGALDFFNNKKIKFLPENPAEKFAKLVFYNAPFCCIESIAKINFKSLKKLRWLYLHSNKIEKVPTNAFEDLAALEVLYLGE